MFLYSGNFPLLYSGNPKSKGGLLKSAKKKSPVNLAIYRTLCGERGIRTPGTLRYAGFQDRCNRPLYHLSLQMVAVVLAYLRVQR